MNPAVKFPSHSLIPSFIQFTSRHVYAFPRAPIYLSSMYVVEIVRDESFEVSVYINLTRSVESWTEVLIQTRKKG